MRLKIILALFLILSTIFIGVNATNFNLNNFYATGKGDIFYPIFAKNCNFISMYSSPPKTFSMTAGCSNYKNQDFYLTYYLTWNKFNETNSRIIATGECTSVYWFNDKYYKNYFSQGSFVIDKVNKKATFACGYYTITDNLKIVDGVH